MKKPITPEGRLEKWKKLWGAVRQLPEEDAETVFEEFVENFVPGHMEKKFRQFFGTPRAKFGNRFFFDDSVYHTFETSLASLGLRDMTHAEATVIYPSMESVEAHSMRGEVRRTLKDLVIDDWHAGAAIVRSGDITMYIFVEPKMKGCIVRRLGAVEEEE